MEIHVLWPSPSEDARLASNLFAVRRADLGRLNTLRPLDLSPPASTSVEKWWNRDVDATARSAATRDTRLDGGGVWSATGRTRHSKGEWLGRLGCQSSGRKLKIEYNLLNMLEI